MEVEAVELDGVVAEFAKKYFGLRVRVFVEDALRFVERKQGLVEEERFDYVVHDLFTGCSVPSNLFSVAAWRGVSGLLKKDGVVAVNFVGSVDKTATMATMAVGVVYDRLKAEFGNVRVFSDGHSTRTHNFVFFASNIKLEFREAVYGDFLDSVMREKVLKEFESFEVSREELGGNSSLPSGLMLRLGQIDTCREHLQLMGKIHPKALWPALFRLEYS